MSVHGASATAEAVGVLLVEEQTLWREFLTQLVESMPGHFIAGSPAERVAAIELGEELRPQLALVVLATPAAASIGIAAALKLRSPQTHVLVLGSEVRAEWVDEAVSAGVSGIVDTSIDRTMLRSAIATVARGGEYFSPAVSSVLTELLRRRGQPADAAQLSFRESQVLREIARGKISKEMAAGLGLSVFTIENIRRRIMRKTGLRSVAALTLHAMKLGLVTPAHASGPAQDGACLRR